MDQTLRIKALPYKFLVFVMYAEDTFSWIRRQDNRYILETKPLLLRFDVPLATILSWCRTLERAGFIYNLSREAGRVRFYINFPRYLTFNSLAESTERYVAERRVPAGGFK